MIEDVCSRVQRDISVRCVKQCSRTLGCWFNGGFLSVRCMQAERTERERSTDKVLRLLEATCARLEDSVLRSQDVL